ncbi:hypothetical protein H1R82_05100 [Thermoactinomyces intermedius]|jgi:hypothetical protein|uniref:Uncharacterized protein n=1 Tax=Thermoactinomyces intermedius TaxID=2024 RepID=A0A8I1A9F0_THEIN|nr:MULTISPECIES: hypothetical protein [Thermoactinomyces]MBA4547987.1 hypothetical protein [Thermoactinomyces intermedius]MBA4836013.1 hypothetical protein [Thermoactinomyces intermedius]MBH8593782.1 hypothetical protein [Thermoactinomyces intermedius]MBH8599828.1 hypothetical protein [Thermoactinomyces sp. CICC 23799]
MMIVIFSMKYSAPETAKTFPSSNGGMDIFWHASGKNSAFFMKTLVSQPVWPGFVFCHEVNNDSVRVDHRTDFLD